MTGFGNNQDNFQSMSPYQAMSSWGAGPQAEVASGFDINSITDPYERFQAESLLKSQGMQQQQLDFMKQANTPPSAWQTGAQTFGNVAKGIGDLGSIYMGLKNMKLQKEAFKFNKGVTNTNLGNSITDYNRRLSDTLANRALNNGQGQGWVSEQLNKYSAKRTP